jgi:hypothetical protein
MSDYLALRNEVVSARRAGRAEEVNAEWCQIKGQVCLRILEGLAYGITVQDRLLSEAFARRWNGPAPDLDLDRIAKHLDDELFADVFSAAFLAAVDVDYTFPVETTGNV